MIGRNGKMSENKAKAVFNVTYKLKEGMLDDFLEALYTIGVARETRKEDGCMGYEYYTSIDDPEKLFLVEHWRDEAAQQAHLKSAHLKKLGEVKDQYVEETIIEKFLVD
jgi:quinol monooxygenase YgiN